VRLLIAEDHALLREGLCRLMTDAGHEVVATAADEEQLDAALRVLPAPDVAILDVRLPPTYTDEGARAALTLRRRSPDVGIVLLSSDVEARYALRLVREHPRGFGYLLKDRVADVDELLEVVVRVAQGGFAVDPDVVSRLLAPARRDSVLDRLTPREHDVLRLVVEGVSNRAIGERLHLSGKTVENHVSSVFAKLDLPVDADEHRRVRAVLIYLQGTGTPTARGAGARHPAVS
jgi:DNA-binding NarL/FixJ family response regulator